MKSKIASLFLLFAAACNNTVSFEETETEESCAAKCREIDCPDMADPETGDCPATGSAGDCGVVYPECDSSSPAVRLPGLGGKAHPITNGIIVYTARDGDTSSTSSSDTSTGDSQ
jgi:hypothetical protein